MNKIRYIDFHPAEYISGVVNHRLNATEQGVYWMVCALMADKGEAIPNDHTWLAGLFPGTHWRTVKAAIDKLLEVGALVQTTGHDGVHRLLKHRVIEGVTRASHRVSQARHAALKRWETNDLTDADASKKSDANHKPITNNQSKERDTNVSGKKNGNGQHPIRDDWAVGPDLVAYAGRYGFSPAEAIELGERMVSWAGSKGIRRKSWYKTYQTFVQREAKERKGNGKATFSDIFRAAEAASDGIGGDQPNADRLAIEIG